jgi:hypothetical protein
MLGRSVAESKAGPSGRARAHTGVRGAESPAVRYIYPWRVDSLVSRHRRVTKNS